MNFLAIADAQGGTLIDNNATDGQTSAPGLASATSHVSSTGIPTAAQRDSYFSTHILFK